jgi:hypothetical protein
MNSSDLHNPSFNMTSNENRVNYKVIDIDEIYNFYIKFFSI